MAPNNMSRNNFKKFLSDNELKRDGSRNVFYLSDQKIIYSENDKKEVRQFYEDCQGAWLNGELYTKDDFNMGSITRITSRGVKAFNATLKEK